MDKKELFQIGEVAKLFHISVGSLRHYEKIGLLPPEYIDKNTGYRYYSTRQFECLNTIRYLRALDTPLEQIGDFLSNRNLDSIQNLLEQQKSAISEKRRELEVIEKKIDNRLNQLRDAVSSELDKIRLLRIPPQKNRLAQTFALRKKLPRPRSFYTTIRKASKRCRCISRKGRRRNIRGAFESGAI